ncbi:unnamed protein product [Strongylus vulgaris]|uniref:Uncharacterized protein n=1 Tax=Strongylus vulgaris TaxID=40348 RepID=A0A3P7L6Y4_STRVU|nr:unnamed protein product [Strongylus vulgaris]
MSKKLSEVRKWLRLRKPIEDSDHEERYLRRIENGLGASPIVETSSYVYFGRSMKIENDLKDSAAFKLRKPQTNSRTQTSHLFDSVVPLLYYAAEMCPTLWLRRRLFEQPTER